MGVVCGLAWPMCQGVDDVAFDAGQVMEVAWVRVYGSP